MISKIFDKRKENELKVLKATIQKRGLECNIIPIIDDTFYVNDIDTIDSDFDNVEVISVNKSSAKATYGTNFKSKLLFIDLEPLTSYDYNDYATNSTYKAYILDDIKVNSIVELDNIARYKVKEILKVNTYSDLKSYVLVRI